MAAPVPYEHFRTSYKPRGDVCIETMCAYGKMLNHEENDSATTSIKCTKFLFSPYLANKLIKDPALFDKRSCSREISRINSNVNLASIDLMHFPVLKPNHHWVLACVNSLFGSINFFDSAGIASKTCEEELLNNLVTNLNTVFKKLGIKSKDLETFKRQNPPKYPAQPTLHDCGLYVML